MEPDEYRRFAREVWFFLWFPRSSVVTSLDRSCGQLYGAGAPEYLERGNEKTIPLFWFPNSSLGTRPRKLSGLGLCKNYAIQYPTALTGYQ